MCIIPLFNFLNQYLEMKTYYILIINRGYLNGLPKLNKIQSSQWSKTRSQGLKAHLR